MVELAGEVLNRYSLEHDPANVTWAFSRLVAAWQAMSGPEPTEAARAAMTHMEARLFALPVEARSEAAQPMAHARVHFATLLQSRLDGMDQHDRTDTLAEIDAQQRPALLIEDPWVFHHFGLIRRDIGDLEAALPLFDQAIALAEDDPAGQAAPRVQRARILGTQGQFEPAMAEFEAARAVRDDWDAETCLHATQAALGLGLREPALAWFGKARARGAAQGRTRGLYVKVEAALRDTRPKWKLWGV